MHACVHGSEWWRLSMGLKPYFLQEFYVFFKSPFIWLFCFSQLLYNFFSSKILVPICCIQLQNWGRIFNAKVKSYLCPRNGGQEAGREITGFYDARANVLELLPQNYCLLSYVSNMWNSWKQYFIFVVLLPDILWIFTFYWLCFLGQGARTGYVIETLHHWILKNIELNKNH